MTLRSLAPPEAAQVFEMLRTRIIASDSFEKAPDGVEGMESSCARSLPCKRTYSTSWRLFLPTVSALGYAVAGGAS